MQNSPSIKNNGIFFLKADKIINANESFQSDFQSFGDFKSDMPFQNSAPPNNPFDDESIIELEEGRQHSQNGQNEDTYTQQQQSNNKNKPIMVQQQMQETQRIIYIYQDNISKPQKIEISKESTEKDILLGLGLEYNANLLGTDTLMKQYRLIDFFDGLILFRLDEFQHLMQNGQYFLIEGTEAVITAQQKRIMDSVNISPLYFKATQTAIEVMKKGSLLYKSIKNSNLHVRFFQLEDDLSKIRWFAKKKTPNQTSVPFEKIIRLNYKEKESNANLEPVPESQINNELQFQIEYQNAQNQIQILLLVFNDQDQYEKWIFGVKALVSRANKSRISMMILSSHCKPNTQLAQNEHADDTAAEHFKYFPQTLRNYYNTLSKSQLELSKLNFKQGIEQNALVFHVCNYLSAKFRNESMKDNDYLLRLIERLIHECEIDHSIILQIINSEENVFNKKEKIFPSIKNSSFDFASFGNSFDQNQNQQKKQKTNKIFSPIDDELSEQAENMFKIKISKKMFFLDSLIVNLQIILCNFLNQYNLDQLPPEKLNFITSFIQNAIYQ